MKPRILFDLQCELVDPRTLKPHPKNATLSLPKHNPKAFEQLKKSLLNGFTAGVKVQRSTGVIIGGHQRVEAAIELGFDVIPVIYEDVDDREALKLLLQDNARFGHSDSLPILTENILELDTGEFDLELLGMDMDLVSHLAEWSPSKVAEEQVPDTAPAKPVVCKSCGAIQ